MKNRQSDRLPPLSSNEEEHLTKSNLLSYLPKYLIALVSYPKAIMSSSVPSISFHQKGNIFCDLGWWQWALKNYEKAIAITPDNHHLWLNSALCLSRLNRYLAALACYEKAIQLNPEHSDMTTYLNWAQMLRHLHRYDEALEVCNQALNRWPNEISIGLKIAEIWCDWGFPDQSLEIYTELLEKYNESDECWEEFGCFQQYRLKYYQGALAAYNRAIYYSPQNIRVWIHTGHCLYCMGRYQDAIGAYDRALKIAPHRHDIRKIRARVQKLIYDS